MKAAVPLPAFAQRVLGNAVRVRQHYEWDPRISTAVLRVAPSMLPISLEAVMQILPGGAGRRPVLHQQPLARGMPRSSARPQD